MSTTKIPAGLGPGGKRLWSDLMAKYVFRRDELAVVERACRLVDRIDAMERDLGGATTSLGSMGQVVVHPLIPEIRAHSATLATLLRGLKLPDDEVGVEAPRSTQAREAARSRWAVAHGAGA